MYAVKIIKAVHKYTVAAEQEIAVLRRLHRHDPTGKRYIF